MKLKIKSDGMILYEGLSSFHYRMYHISLPNTSPVVLSIAGLRKDVQPGFIYSAPKTEMYFKNRTIIYYTVIRCHILTHAMIRILYLYEIKQGRKITIGLFSTHKSRKK